MMPEVNIRPYRPADMQGILDLVNMVQPHAPFTPERWCWEYPDCAGTATVLVVEHEGRIVGHHGATAFPWWCR